jgi:rare lipoprotein A
VKSWRLAALAALLAGCASQPQAPAGPDGGPANLPGSSVPGIPPPPRSGGYYMDDGPGDQPPANLSEVPDAVPAREPLHRYANRPYTVFGKGYVPLSALQPYRERGRASWYGRKFHGQRTSSGEVYDMYKMTGAHKTLPIPSYARVTNVANGRSVVVRINDRGPFHSDRVIDLSYAAAHRLGYVQAGSAMVEVETILPGDPASARTTDAARAEAGPVTSGHYLQLGAFSSRDNAEELRSRLASQLAWLQERVEVRSVGELWRLHVGPYGTSEAARAIAERIETELNLKPFLVVR